MKIFISWSGEQSRRIAEVLRHWLPSVIQAIRPYYSPDDIAKGSKWNIEISRELESCSIGIICLTPTNKNAAWIMFEAGALSKQVETSKVCPILFGMDTTEIEGPLTTFQLAKYSKDELFRVLKMINEELQDQRLQPETLRKSFEVWWPELEQSVDAILSEKSANQPPKRPERDMLEEVLETARDSSLSIQRVLSMLQKLGTSGFENTNVTKDDNYVLENFVNRFIKKKSTRLGAAAMEFNISRDIIVKFLREKGFEIIDSPSTKITDAMYEYLELEFAKYE